MARRGGERGIGATDQGCTRPGRHATHRVHDGQLLGAYMGDVRSRLRAAIESGRRARTDFYKTLDLEDEQRLGPPASESQIQSLELKVARMLPPSYRAFLALHNGWRMVDASTDLLEIDELVSGDRAARIAAWQEQERRYGELRFADGLVIGHSTIGQARIILDPSEVDDDGEWAVIAVDKDSEENYRSFLEWLEQSAVDYRELADEDEADSEGLNE